MGTLVPTLAHAVRKHNKCSASGHKRWRGCPGSVQACEALPPLPTTDAATWGTLCHELAERWLRSGRPLDAQYLPLESGEEAILDPGRRAIVQPYIEAVRAELDANPGAELIVEEQFDGAWLDPDMGGTVDALIKVPFSHVVVIDLKTGRHAVEDQTQLAIYAILAMWEDGGWGDYQYAETVIVQPTADHADGPVRRVRWYTHELQALAKVLAADAAKTREPNAPRSAGEHCRWCAAKGVCPEAAREVARVAGADFDPVEQTVPADAKQAEVILPSPKLMDEVQLGRALGFCSLVEDWAEDVRRQAKARLLAMKPVPGFKLVPADRTWANEAAAIQLMEQLGVEPYVQKVRTVAQAEEWFVEAEAQRAGGKRGAKKAAKEAFETAAAEQVVRPVVNAKMVKESDRRTALVIDPAAAATVTFDGSADDHDF